MSKRRLVITAVLTGQSQSQVARTYGVSPTAYRATFPPASNQVRIPTCVLRAYGRPQHSTFREDNGAGRG